MCRATPFVLLLLLSMNATAEPKALRVPADYPTLAAAIEAAAPGDTVALAAGQYPLTAQLLITKPVQIKGEAAESTVIQTTLAKDELIKVDKVDGFRIENVTLEYAGPPQPQDRTDFPSLLSVFGGRAEVEHCNFRNSSGFGLIIKQGAGAAIRHCRAENNLTVGIYVKEPGTSASVTNNEAIKNGSDGIMTYDGATASVEENRCAENGGNGIIIDGPTAGETVVRANTCGRNRKNGIRAGIDAKVRIADNDCRGNAESGIAVDTGSTGTVSGNTCRGCRLGIAIRSMGTHATVEKNTCSECFEAGLGVFFGAKAAITGNTCTKNTGAGIWVSHWETSAEVQDNICDTNDNNGILVDTGGHASVRGNECNGNGHYGILVSDEDSGADIGNNSAKDNVKGDHETVAGLPAKYQYQVRPYEIGTAFMRGQIDYLERMAKRLRHHQSRYDDGGWQLYYFYDGIIHGNAAFSMHERPDFRVALEKWAAQYPDSCTPRIALATVHLEYGWEARGTGWAREVTAEGWKALGEHLDEAEKWCAEAESKEEKDPQLYATWIDIAKGQSASKAHIRALLDKGMAVDPAYYGLYSSACQTLWPRWGGSRGQITDFFTMVHERTREKMGEKMYAFVVDSQFCPGAVYGDSADWNLVKPGFDQVLEEFPRSVYYLNRYCLLACVFGDKEKARELFGRIGDNPNYGAWIDKKENFDRAKRWALSDGPLPDFFQVDGHSSGNADERAPIPIPALSAIAGLSRQKIAIGLVAAAAAVCLLTIFVIFLIVHLSRKKG